MRRGAGGRNLALHVRENTTLWGEAVRLFQSGKHHAALECFSQMDYVTATVCFNTGTVHLALGNYESAIEMYTETLRRDTHFALAYFQRALAFHHYGWNEDALRDLHECHRRLRGNKFIDYHNLGLDHVLWECQVLANIAIIYIVLGLKRHAIHNVDTALQSRKASLVVRESNNTQALLEAAIPDSFVEDIFSHCKRKENHAKHSCATLPLQPPPLFRARGLSSLWLHASQRIKKNFLGKAKVVYCRGSQKEPGFAGAQAMAAGKPLPVKEEKQGIIAAAIRQVVARSKNDTTALRDQRTKSDLGPCAVQRAEAQRVLQEHSLYKERSKTTPAESIAALHTVQECKEERMPERKRATRESSAQSERLPPLPTQQPAAHLIPTPLVFAHPFCLQVTDRHTSTSSSRLLSCSGNENKTRPARPAPPQLHVEGHHNYGLAIPQLLGAGSDDDDSEDDSCDSGALFDDAEALSGTEAVALISLQLLSEELNKADSSPRTQALLKAISALTEQLQGYDADNNNDQNSMRSPRSSQPLQPMVAARTHGDVSNIPPKKPPRPPRFDANQFLPSPPEVEILDRTSSWQCSPYDISDAMESTTGSKSSTDSGVQDVYENTQTLVLPSLPKVRTQKTPPARPKFPPSFQKSQENAMQQDAHRADLKQAISQMAFQAGNLYQTVGTAGPMVPKRPPPPLKGFSHEMEQHTSARGSTVGKRVQKMTRRQKVDSGDSDTDSTSSSGCSTIQGASRLRRPIARPRTSSTSSNNRQPWRNAILTSVSSLDRIEPESHMTREQLRRHAYEAENEYEPIAFEDNGRHDSEQMTSSMQPVRQSVTQPKSLQRHCGPCQLRATNILSKYQPVTAMPVQYV